MELKKLENKCQWLLKVDGQSYLRTQIDWYDNDNQQSVKWHHIEYPKKGIIYLRDEILEELFWENNSKSNTEPEMPQTKKSLIKILEDIRKEKEVEKPNLEIVKIEVPDGKQIVRTDLEDGVLITFEDIEKEEYVEYGERRYLKSVREEELAKFAERLKTDPIYGEIHHPGKNPILW